MPGWGIRRSSHCRHWSHHRTRKVKPGNNINDNPAKIGPLATNSAPMGKNETEYLYRGEQNPTTFVRQVNRVAFIRKREPILTILNIIYYIIWNFHGFDIT